MTKTPQTQLQILRDQTVLITGGTSGIGLATATAMARSGARVVVAARNVEKGRRAVAGLPGPVEVRRLDLSDLESVRRFASEWDRPIEVLINNAGVSLPTLQRTADGLEMQFATNYLGPWALTNLLLPRIKGRVVVLASQAERGARLDLDDLGFTRAPYKESRAYNNSKLADLLLVHGLQRRLTAAGSTIRAVAAHPGFVATDIYAQTTGVVARTMIRLLAQGPDDGALPVLLAAAGDLPGGSFTGPEKMAHMRGGAELISSSRRSKDVELADRLWSWSEQRTGITFPLPVASDGLMPSDAAVS